MLKTIEHDLPAHWASALINGDRSGLDTDPLDAQEFNEWSVQNPQFINPVSCSENAFIGRWNGIQMELLTYQYLVSVQS